MEDSFLKSFMVPERTRNEKNDFTDRTVPVDQLILKLAADSILLILGIFDLLASSGNPEENRK